MNEMVRITRSADEQLVSLPEGYRFDTDDVRITKQGHRVILEPGGPIDEETGLPIATLRALVQEGLDSGPSEPWDPEAMKSKFRERRARILLGEA